MLPSLSQTTSGAKRRTLLFLAAVAVAALALPTMKWATRAQSVGPAALLAGDAPAGDSGGKAAAGDRREKPGSESKGRDARIEVEYLPRPSKFEEKVLAALEKPTDVAFVDLALEDCIAFLEEASKIPMLLDKQTLTDEGVALDQPVTLKLKGARLESVLNLILNQVQLTYLPENDVLMITTSTKAGEKLITRTYPVRDLFHGRVHFDVAGPLKSNDRTQKNDGAQKNDKVTASGAASPAKSDEAAGDSANGDNAGGGKGGTAGGQGRQPHRYADLVDAITNIIQPDSWDDLSGPGTFTYVQETGCLVIRQTLAVHREILQLFRDLREAKRLAPGKNALTPDGDARR